MDVKCGDKHEDVKCGGGDKNEDRDEESVRRM